MMFPPAARGWGAAQTRGAGASARPVLLVPVGSRLMLLTCFCGGRRAGKRGGAGLKEAGEILPRSFPKPQEWTRLQFSTPGAVSHWRRS